MDFPFTVTDYILMAAVVFGSVWVVYGILKRVVVFALLLIAALALLVGVGYFQTGRFSGGFFSERSAIVRFVGQLVDGYRQGAFR